MKEEKIVIKIEYDKNEGRILIGDFILAKIYSTKDGLMITTIEEKNKEILEE